MSINPDVIILQPHTKDQVDYRQHQSCKTCGYFNGRNKCSQVQGNISPDAVCNLWTLSETMPHMTGKEIIINEYEKSKKGVGNG